MVATRKTARRKVKLLPPSAELAATWRLAVYGGPGDYPFPNPATRPAVIDAVVVKEQDLYLAQCLTVDESSFGRTPAEALARLQEAVEIHYEERARRLAVPSEVLGTAQVTL